ncbi:LysM peptidoglycan-binding domain-containing protein [Curtobacterium sp. DN_7.5]|uniref:LysM peptidoglycan-binding domain-containing protein n=1 Tax=Curtobacterium sp. DN_7.5 TaxID=3049047 RepID=UPI001F572A89|nr:LysM peptidoglycan-binding domain-containing protein [Curtobacterium sp. DN_7.5]
MDNAADEAARRARSARFATVPIVLAGTIAVTAGLTGPVAHAEPRHDDEGAGNKRHVDQDRNEGDRPVFSTAVARPATTRVTTVAAVAQAPTTYTVRQGDTVSGIAARYGLSAQEVLVRNGLGWNTIIHPGQTLHLTSAPAVHRAPARTATTTSTSTTSSYHVRSGDTVSGIAARIGVSTSALLGANNLSQRSVIYPGQTLRVPSAHQAAPSSPRPVVSTSTATASSGSVKISTGDTIASIAAEHHVSVKALLAANGLSYTSTIYAGKTLVLPGASTGAAVSTSVKGSSTTLSAEQWRNAATIVSVGRSLGVPQRGLVVALAAAMQESSLRNLADGDRDSVGLFQQRPSQGWGSKASLQDPATAAKRFFLGNPGHTRGLLDVRGWSSMSVTDAAQAVQVSAYPTAYAKWGGPAETWLASL